MIAMLCADDSFSLHMPACCDQTSYRLQGKENSLHKRLVTRLTRWFLDTGAAKTAEELEAEAAQLRETILRIGNKRRPPKQAPSLAPSPLQQFASPQPAQPLGAGAGPSGANGAAAPASAAAPSAAVPRLFVGDVQVHPALSSGGTEAALVAAAAAAEAAQSAAEQKQAQQAAQQAKERAEQQQREAALAAQLAEQQRRAAEAEAVAKRAQVSG